MSFYQSVRNFGRFINKRILHIGVLPAEIDCYNVSGVIAVCFFVMMAIYVVHLHVIFHSKIAELMFIVHLVAPET